MRLNSMAPTMLRERFQQSVTANSFRSYLAEFLSTFFYVFAVVGSSMSASESFETRHFLLVYMV